MPFLPQNSTIFQLALSDRELAELFSDQQFCRQMILVEVALAQTQAALGVIPAAAASSIAEAASDMPVDLHQLQQGVELAGVPVIGLVKQMRQRLIQAGASDAADYVHWGATTQDIMDTAAVLQMRQAIKLIRQRLVGTIANLAQLADQHRLTLIAGRTHSQQALPTSFGLKVANWIAPLLRHLDRLKELEPRLYVVQFAGAAGTLASLGDHGIAVQAGLAKRLDLGVATAPWHTQRDSIAEAAGWLSMVSGSLGKMAQDVILMAQSEVGELLESDNPTRGGSSTMPQKRNPIISEQIVALARLNAQAVSTIHHAQIQEHERATHGWQLEWMQLGQMFVSTGAAVAQALFLSQNLQVNEASMRKNVEASQGLMLAERVAFALSQHMERAAAKELVRKACLAAIVDDKHLIELLGQMTDLPLDWNALSDEAGYLGSASQFIDQVLEAAAQTTA